MKNQNDRGMKSKIVPMAVLGGIVLLSVGCGLASCSWSPSVLAVDAVSEVTPSEVVTKVLVDEVTTTSNLTATARDYDLSFDSQLPSYATTGIIYQYANLGGSYTLAFASYSHPYVSGTDYFTPLGNTLADGQYPVFKVQLVYSIGGNTFKFESYPGCVFNGRATFSSSISTFTCFDSYSRSFSQSVSSVSVNCLGSSFFIADGANDLYQNGYNNGYAVGYGKGTATGLDNGKEQGYQSGYSQGVADGYQQGYTTGYQESGSFLSQLGGLIGNVVMLPVNVIMSVLDFNVLGVNISSVVKSLITIVLVLFIIRLIFNMPVKIENGAKPSDSEVTHHVESRTSQLNSKGELQGTISHYSHETTSKRHGK